MPDTPDGHALIGWILLPPGTTEITSDLINRNYVAPFVSQIVAYPTSLELAWATGSDTITINVLDQYGNGITTQRWKILAEILSGTGTVTDSRTCSSGTSSVEFTYSRVADYDDPVSPVAETGPVYIEFTLSQNSGITMLTPVILLDSGGDIIV
jgi:hypothetical protein